MILIPKASIRNVVLSNCGSRPLIPIDSEIKQREIKNNFRFPMHSSSHGRMNGNTNAGRDQDANMIPVVAVSTPFYSAMKGKDG